MCFTWSPSIVSFPKRNQDHTIPFHVQFLFLQRLIIALDNLLWSLASRFKNYLSGCNWSLNLNKEKYPRTNNLAFRWGYSCENLCTRTPFDNKNISLKVRGWKDSKYKKINVYLSKLHVLLDEVVQQFTLLANIRT